MRMLIGTKSHMTKLMAQEVVLPPVIEKGAAHRRCADANAGRSGPDDSTEDHDDQTVIGSDRHLLRHHGITRGLGVAFPICGQNPIDVSVPLNLHRAK